MKNCGLETKENDVVTKTEKNDAIIDEYKKRMLLWPNPVEYVNNMYGCHPWEIEQEYFEVVFSEDSVNEPG